MNTIINYGEKNSADVQKRKRTRKQMQVSIGRFIDGYGTNSGLFIYGFSIIKIRSHCWGMSLAEQKIMESRWLLFAQALKCQGVDRLSLMTPKSIHNALTDISKNIQSDSDNDFLYQMNSLCKTVNHVFSVLAHLQWVNIRYQGRNQIEIPWVQPAPPCSSDFYAAGREQHVKWVGRGMQVHNSGCAPTLEVLGNDAIRYCYRNELTPKWIEVYRQGWEVFEAWSTITNTDRLTVEDIENFAIFLFDQSKGPLPVENAVASLNIVNDVLGRLRGPHWKRVAHRFTPDQVELVPHPKQPATISIKDMLEQEQYNKVSSGVLRLKDPSVRSAVRSNYFLGTSILNVLKKAIHLSSIKSKNGDEFKHHEHRLMAVRAFCNSMRDKGIINLCDLSGSHINSFIHDQYALLDNNTISEKDMKTRVISIITLLNSIRPLQLKIPNSLKDFDNVEIAWFAPGIASESEADEVLEIFDQNEYFRGKITNLGYGFGIQTPLIQVAKVVMDEPPTEDEMISLTSALCDYFTNVHLKQLDQIRNAHIEKLLTLLDHCVDCGTTTAEVAESMLDLINAVMPVFIGAWKPRTLASVSQPAYVDHLITSVDNFQTQPPHSISTAHR